MGNPDMIVIINDRAILIKGPDWVDYYDAIQKAMVKYKAELDESMKEFKMNEKDLADGFSLNDWYDSVMTIRTIKTYAL